MLDYDLEAERYDSTRGGVPRASAAAEAIASLLPSGVETVLDVAGGTGIVAESLASLGFRPIVADRSIGMLHHAAARQDLAGRVLQLDGTRLPLASGSVDAVSMIWLLHLVPSAVPFIAEASRVVKPGGVFLTTVNKNGRPDSTDDRALIEATASAQGFQPAGVTTFIGHGQRGTPTYTLLALRRADR